MSDLVAMADRHESLLSELAQLGMAMARDLQARVAAAADTKEAAEAALAFHRISRSLRQTVALEAKLARDRHAPNAKAAELAQRHERVRRRHAEVSRAVEALIWREQEGDEAENLVMDLHEMLADAVNDEGFADDPFDSHVARVCADLGLEAPDLTPRHGDDDPRREPGHMRPEPPSASPMPIPPAGLADEAWRSSA